MLRTGRAGRDGAQDVLRKKKHDPAKGRDNLRRHVSRLHASSKHVGKKRGLKAGHL